MTIDANMRRLVKALNSIDGVDTYSSCGGHHDPTPGQVPAGTWYVCFDVDDEYLFANQSIELITREAGEQLATVSLYYDGGLRFELRGVDIDPDDVALALEQACKAETVTC